MKISIVIPVFDQAQYLPDAIESVLAQTVKPHEIIVVDDGSPDDSAEIASKYPVKLIRQVNKGLASARNTGIMNMTGDFFLPLDSDDILLPNAIEKMLETIYANPDADIVAPSFKEFGIRNTTVLLMPEPRLEDFKTANRIGYFSAIKKEVLLEVGGYSPRMIHGYEDLHMWINLLSLDKKIVTIPEVLVLYRTKQQSMINVAIAHHDELMAQIKKDFPNL